MPPIGTAAPGNSALLVARILQPLARSLEDARRHLNLETVASDEAADDTNSFTTSGALGILIPPSIVMVMYSVATNTSVGATACA